MRCLKSRFCCGSFGWTLDKPQKKQSEGGAFFSYSVLSPAALGFFLGYSQAWKQTLVQHHRSLLGKMGKINLSWKDDPIEPWTKNVVVEKRTWDELDNCGKMVKSLFMGI